MTMSKYESICPICQKPIPKGTFITFVNGKDIGNIREPDRTYAVHQEHVEYKTGAILDTEDLTFEFTDPTIRETPKNETKESPIKPLILLDIRNELTEIRKILLKISSIFNYAVSEEST